MMLIDLKSTDKAAQRQKTLQKAPLRSSGKIGSDIRALRRSRNWTLNDLAEQLDRSVGWLSQVERNVSEPALDDIRKIAGLFSLPVSFFFTDAAERLSILPANSFSSGCSFSIFLKKEVGIRNEPREME